MYAKLTLPGTDDASCLLISAVSPLFGLVQPSTNNVLDRSVSPALPPRSSVVDVMDGVLQALRIRLKKIPSSLLAIDTCSHADQPEKDSYLDKTSLVQAGNSGGYQALSGTPCALVRIPPIRLNGLLWGLVGGPCAFLPSEATRNERSFEKERQCTPRQREWTAQHPLPYRGRGVAGEGDQLPRVSIEQHGGGCFLPTLKIPESSPHLRERHLQSFKRRERLFSRDS